MNSKKDLTMEEILARIKNTMDARNKIKENGKNGFREVSSDNHKTKNKEPENMKSPSPLLEHKFSGKYKNNSNTENETEDKDPYILNDYVNEEEKLPESLENIDPSDLTDKDDTRTEPSLKKVEEAGKDANHVPSISEKESTNSDFSTSIQDIVNKVKAKEGAKQPVVASRSYKTPSSFNRSDIKKADDFLDKAYNASKQEQDIKPTKQTMEIHKTDNNIKKNSLYNEKTLETSYSGDENVFILTKGMIYKEFLDDKEINLKDIANNINAVSSGVSKHLAQDLTITYLQPKIEGWFKNNLKSYLKKYIK
jgi:hypothetical protein